MNAACWPIGAWRSNHHSCWTWRRWSISRANWQRTRWKSNQNKINGSQIRSINRQRTSVEVELLINLENKQSISKRNSFASYLWMNFYIGFSKTKKSKPEIENYTFLSNKTVFCWTTLFKCFHTFAIAVVCVATFPNTKTSNMCKQSLLHCRNELWKTWEILMDSVPHYTCTETTGKKQFEKNVRCVFDQPYYVDLMNLA